MEKEVYERYVNNIEFEIRDSSGTGLSGIMVIANLRSAVAPRERSI